MNDHSLSEAHFSVLFQIALDLFRRPSPSGREDLVRAYAVEHLEHCGFAVSVDEAGNVLAVRGIPDPGESYPLLSFHMDCVSYEPSLSADRAGLFAASASGSSSVLSSIHVPRHRAQRDRAAELSLRPSTRWK